MGSRMIRALLPTVTNAVNASMPAPAMTQPAPRTVRFLLHHPSQNQGFREMLGPPSPTQSYAVSNGEGLIDWSTSTSTFTPGVRSDGSGPLREIAANLSKAAAKPTKKPSRAKAPPLSPPQEPPADLLAAELALTMLWIPPGRFWMGSPQTEPEHLDSESPQHLVQLQGFFISQTPITQAQWREVAGWQELPGEFWMRHLKTEPSCFQTKSRQEDNDERLLEGESNTEQRPVEEVSWLDAMEFCSRLSRRTGRTYTLPSEAQWEYACRAGTTTPFHFGDTISSELANYDGNNAYAKGPKGFVRKQTTPVGMFPANAWGLQGMHGNVFEWCLDEWHESYEGAPVDGQAWIDLIDGEKSIEIIKSKLYRGGSWFNFPMSCRSASRNHFKPDGVLSYVGFRVVCLPQVPSPNP